jgi:hypothetical protein
MMKIDRYGLAAGRWPKGFSSRIDLDWLVPKHFAEVRMCGVSEDSSSRNSQMT